MGFPEGTTVLRRHHHDNVIVARATIPGIAVQAGIAFLGISISIAAAQAAPARTVATALALLELAIGIGSAIGAQLLATVVGQVGTVGALPTKQAFTAGFTHAAGTALTASLVALAAGSGQESADACRRPSP